MGGGRDRYTVTRAHTDRVREREKEKGKKAEKRKEKEKEKGKGKERVGRERWGVKLVGSGVEQWSSGAECSRPRTRLRLSIQSRRL